MGENAGVPLTPFREWRKVKAEFIDMTTLHGLRRAGDQTGTVSTPRRYSWALLMALGLSAIIVITLDQIEEYRKHPTSTKTMIMYTNDPLLFPAVTICSLNRFYKYAIPSQQDIIQMDAYDLAEITFSEDVPFDSFERKILSDLGYELSQSQENRLLSDYKNCTESNIQLTTQKKALLRSMLHIRCGTFRQQGRVKNNREKSIQNLLDTYGFNMEKSLIRCRFGNERSRQCSADNFIPVYSTKYGLCWTFNSKKSGRTLWHQSHNGIAGGLRLEIANPQESFISRRLKGSPIGAGFKVTLHEPKELPDVDESGFFFGPGFHSFAQVEMTKEEHVSPPWGQCVHGKSKYTQNKAEHECRRLLSMKRCGCAPPTYAAAAHGKFCSPKQLALCLFNVKWTANSSTEHNPYDDSELKVLTKEWQSCTRPSACETNKYKAYVSGVAWPSVPDIKEYQVSMNTSKEKLQQDFLIINIYFPELKYQHIKEYSMIYFTNLISKFGGTVGLFLGASFLTVLELVELTFLYCRRHAKTTHNSIRQWQSMSNLGSATSLTTRDIVSH